MIFFLEAISTWTCGGMVKNEPPEAPRSIATTAKPFFTLVLMRLYALINLSSIWVSYSADFLRSAASSFSVSARISFSSSFLCLRCVSLASKRSLESSTTAFFCSICALNSRMFFSANSISSS